VHSQHPAAPARVLCVLRPPETRDLHVRQRLVVHRGALRVLGRYLTEVFRAGVNSVPVGYTEAAKALGLAPWQRVRLITLPVTFRIILPSLSNTFISLFKDTALASALAVPELTYAAEWLNVNTFR